ncbi:MAG TPA: putative maltokinase, partial [Verrucomicrobiae bacterium]
SIAILEPPQGRRSFALESFTTGRDWSDLLAGHSREEVAAALSEWLPTRRWFRGKARAVQAVTLHEQIDVPMPGQKAFLVLFEVAYAEGEPELYVAPLMAAFGPEAQSVTREWPQMVLAGISLGSEEGVLYDAIVNKDFCRALLNLTADQHKISGHSGQLEAEPTEVLQQVRREHGLNLEPSVGKAEQSNSSIVYKGALILKFFRRLDAGINPELEIERFLTARRFSYSPPLAGALEYHDHNGRTSTVAIITSFIPGCHDTWEDTLSALEQFYNRVEELKDGSAAQELPGSIFTSSSAPAGPATLIGSYLQDAATLGRRTAALHLTLASDPDDPAFRPEPWNEEWQRALADDLQQLTRENFQLLRQRLPVLAPEVTPLAEKTLAQEAAVAARLRQALQQPVSAARIRHHGDYHLGQVLHHGSDFLIIDFEGEPAISLDQRRAKQSALRDVAGMVYSFFYAANAVVQGRSPRPAVHLPVWARYWSLWVAASFLRAYLETAGTAPFVPVDQAAFKNMLDAELLRKAIYELGYELNNRPDWLNIAFQVLLDLLHPKNPI